MAGLETSVLDGLFSVFKRAPSLVFTSNVFAILGLRSLYFALAGIGMFRYLKGVSRTVLILVGVKMLAAPWLKEALGANIKF